MRGAPLYVYSQCRGVAAQLGANPRLIDEFKEFAFQFGVFRHRIAFINRTRERQFGKEGCSVHGTADTNTDNHRRARIHAGMEDDVHNSFLDTFHTISRHQHLNAGFVLGTKALRCHGDFELVTSDNLRVDDTRCVVLGVHTVKERFADHGFTQIAFGVTFGNTCIYRVFQEAARNVQVLTDF